MTRFGNGVSQAAEERLQLLIEECGEAIQAAAKILRHGFDSTNPDVPHSRSNRAQLEHELGHIKYAIELLCREGNLDYGAIVASKTVKGDSIGKWLHFNKGG